MRLFFFLVVGFSIPAFKGQEALGGLPVVFSRQSRTPALAGMTSFAKMTMEDSTSVSVGEAEEIIIQIEKGMSLQSVARLLKKEKLINSVFYFKVLAGLRGDSTKIQSGEYAFQKPVTSWEILDTLVEGKTRLHRITFYEGYNIYEMAKALEEGNFLDRKKFISLCHDSDFIYELLKEKKDSLEGYLFPDTYYVPLPVDPEKLIRKMVKGFFNAYNKISRKGLKTAGVDSSLRLTRHETVILASIVEKETGLAKERSLIASVFYNRLKKGMRLESDPTILYGMMREAGDLVTLNIRKKDILRKTPYNTYRLFGFPAGPISNPGEESLRAVFEPEDSSFFYFVSRNDGSHVFSKTYEEHKKAVDRYQRRILRRR